MTPVGSASVRDTLGASLGPSLVTRTAQTISSPSTTTGGATAETLRLAEQLMVAEAEPEEGETPVAEAVAVSVRLVPSATEEETRAVTLKLVEAPAARLAMVSSMLAVPWLSVKAGPTVCVWDT